jgi:hypothetical protein
VAVVEVRRVGQPMVAVVADHLLVVRYLEEMVEMELQHGLMIIGGEIMLVQEVEVLVDTVVTEDMEVVT